jgi:hypothetical protein
VSGEEAPVHIWGADVPWGVGGWSSERRRRYRHLLSRGLSSLDSELLAMPAGHHAGSFPISPRFLQQVTMPSQPRPARNGV